MLALAAAALLTAPASVRAAEENDHPQVADVPPGEQAAGQDLMAAVPDSAAAEDRQFAQNYLLGDWGGVRGALWDQGVQVKLLLISDPYGNPMGERRGASPGTTWSAPI